ncbi:hypothetical protein SCOR_13305 [Sulfidibacter corallicola]|uniref:Uncharacterized protein n=1 Tax=Sulfidibacter corallicola TaxID=2818388 RepID=A0A8A4TG05_SULCO|nr:zinc-ribbon domain-containing protein [Sulfidibacter corallicola]QTD47701.1 hypothetical protein J3U87_19090 [Sulfidibacter corallicola]
MNLEIKCPECGKTSTIALAKVPLGKLKTTCNSCKNQFFMDKGQSLNCQILSNENGNQDLEGYPDTGWKVDHPICQGIEYDLAGLGGLVRSGLVTEATRILPPAATQYMEARHLKPLKKFFDQKEKMDSRAH